MEHAHNYCVCMFVQSKSCMHKPVFNVGHEVFSLIPSTDDKPSNRETSASCQTETPVKPQRLYWLILTVLMIQTCLNDY